MDIKSGEYVRTHDGRIYIISYYSEEEKRYISVTENDWYPVYKSEIKSHSENILDLIEDGDFVNGYSVRKINGKLCNFDLNEMEWIPLENIDVLEDIVTKEQFKRGKYIVGG